MAALTQLRRGDRCEARTLFEEDGIQPPQLLGHRPIVGASANDGRAEASQGL